MVGGLSLSAMIARLFIAFHGALLGTAKSGGVRQIGSLRLPEDYLCRSVVGSIVRNPVRLSCRGLTSTLKITVSKDGKLGRKDGADFRLWPVY